jgi:UDP-N-acetylglucosamine 2-epimerase (non-hydrolysing)
MTRIDVHLIAAARPNFMKVAPLYHALEAEKWCHPIIVHTGQHYDANMSDEFFRDLGLPDPHFHLAVGSGTHAEQTAGVMVAYEKLCLDRRPDWIVVVGDVNSTMACALVGSKLQLPVAHLEAGLRSRDRGMPEEINRLVTDAVADVLWTPSPDADENLRAEGVPEERITRVGNIMIDSYELMRPQIERQDKRRTLGLEAGRYGLVTLHRPSNVDDAKVLEGIVARLCSVSHRLPLVFAVHPRTRARLREFELEARLEEAPGMTLVEPMGYIAFMGLMRESMLAITDSGGLQEETTYLNIPCLTVRDTTERPITVDQGTNRLIAPEDLEAAVDRVLDGKWPSGRRPDLWDGRTAERIVRDLARRSGIAREQLEKDVGRVAE